MNTPTTNSMITPIDLGFRGIDERVSAILIDTAQGPVLVDCGPAACLNALEAGLAQHGTSLEQIEHLLVTHIHLDHAGACGQVTARNTHAHVHPRGAPHLIDPTKLNASTRRVFGDALDTDLGQLEPSEADRVHAVEDGETLSFGGVQFQAIETPGHATHHHAWLLDDGKERHLFAGDVAGMRLPGSEFATLPLVAPEFDRNTWLDSIQRLRSVAPDAIWLTHFGRIPDHDPFLDQVASRLQEESDFIVTLLDSAPGADPETLIPEYRAWHAALASAHGVNQELHDLHCDDDHFRANIVGVARWNARRD